MRQKRVNIISVIIAFLLGVGAMYYIVGNIEINGKTINENRNVTITDTGIAASVEKIYNSVVIVHVETKKTSGWGSGFFYKADDKYVYILTNHHVIEDAKTIEVEFMDETKVDAELVGSDMYADIAVLKIEKKDGVKLAPIGKTDDLRLGDTVFTVGTPIDLEYKGSVTRGIISGLNRFVSVSVENSYSEDYILKAIQIDASINGGNSGGPLCNANGEVIGINTMKIASSTVDNIGFSIPIDDALMYAEELEQYGKIERPLIGVSLYELDAAKYHYPSLSIKDIEGLYVDDVTKGSAADKAGIKSGDIITKIGDKKVSSFKQFKYELYKYRPNDKTTIEVLRDGKKKTLQITLGKSK